MTDSRICVVSTALSSSDCRSGLSASVTCWQDPSENANCTVLGRHCCWRRTSSLDSPPATEIALTVIEPCGTIRIDSGPSAAVGVDGGTHGASAGFSCEVCDQAVVHAVLDRLSTTFGAVST